MNPQIALFLKNNYSAEPFEVDKILVSAFIKKNRLEITRNVLLQKYLIKDTNVTESAKLNTFLKVLAKYSIKLTIEDLIELFEFVISPADKVITGAVYTPSIIRKYIIEKTLLANKSHLLKVADISCGCGGFLYNAAQKIKKHTGKTYYRIFKEQIFGLDIQKYSITRTKLLLTLLAVFEGEDKEVFIFNLFYGNALSFNWERHLENFSGFDLIVGNPPYVCSRNISEESKKLLKRWEVSKSGHPDLYIPFFQIALTNLKDNGTMGYITMNTFFKSINGRAIRKYFQDQSYFLSIIDFNTLQIFKSKSTYTCICIINKSESKQISYFKCTDLQQISSPLTFQVISYKSLNALEGWNLNPNIEIINQIERTGVPFKDKYKTRNGIATLKNNVYIFTPETTDRHYYYFNGGTRIEKSVCKEIVNPNLLITENQLNNIKEIIIFPYEFVNEKAVIIPEEKFKKDFPNAYSYLLDHRTVLAGRDKGKGKKYKPWYIYGRNQSLEKLEHKLFFPHITPKTPNYLIDSDKELLFYNGIAVLSATVEDLTFLAKLMSSRLFWFYIKNTSKPYASSYFSLSRNYLKNFGVFNFSKEQKQYIIKENDKIVLDIFFEKIYNVTLP